MLNEGRIKGRVMAALNNDDTILEIWVVDG